MDVQLKSGEKTSTLGTTRNLSYLDKETIEQAYGRFHLT